MGQWLLRAAEGFTGRANSALPLGDPGLPPDAAADAVARWYQARGLPPMIAVPLPLEGDSPARALDAFLSERTWVTRSGPALVMVADLPLTGTAGSPAEGEFLAGRRRAGLGEAITAAACAEAISRGIRKVFLQVEVGNTPARALYERCGFRYSHRYHYRVAPPAT